MGGLFDTVYMIDDCTRIKKFQLRGVVNAYNGSGSDSGILNNEN